MADIHIVRNHTMPLNKAREAAAGLAAPAGGEIRSRNRSGDGDTLQFERPGAQGTLALEPGSVTIDVRLGLLLSAFRAAMEEQINAQLDQLFSGGAALAAKGGEEKNLRPAPGQAPISAIRSGRRIPASPLRCPCP